MCGLWQPQAAMAASITASSCFSAALPPSSTMASRRSARGARCGVVSAGAAAPRLVEASSVTVVHTCLLASLCCFGFDLKIVNMVEEIQVELISLRGFFKTFQKYFPYANFELFISLVQFFGQNIWLMRFFGYSFHYCDLPYANFGLFISLLRIFG